MRTIGSVKRFFTALLFLFPLLLLFLQTTEATYKVRKKETVPVFANASEERLYRLRHGEVLADGGYLPKGVWGRMEGLIQAPPDVVWRLYLQANDWKRYRLPNLFDSRAVSEEVARFAASTQKVEDFYKVLGDRFFDPEKDRRKGGVWTNHTFQYFDIPWPIANRWFVVRSLNDETKAHEGIYRAEWVKAAGNVRTIEGEILFEPFEGRRNLTRMEYNVKSDPGSSVPKFLVKWGVKKSMPAAIRAIRREAARVSRRPAPAD